VPHRIDVGTRERLAVLIHQRSRNHTGSHDTQVQAGQLLTVGKHERDSRAVGARGSIGEIHVTLLGCRQRVSARGQAGKTESPGVVAHGGSRDQSVGAGDPDPDAPHRL
jgi:hypothetical protein